MSRWVRTYLKYPVERAAEVEKLVLNEDGLVDFRVLLPIELPHQIDDISIAAHLAARKLMLDIRAQAWVKSRPAWRDAEKVPDTFSRLWLDADIMETAGRARSQYLCRDQLRDLLVHERLVEQACQMLENAEKTGYLHNHDAACGLWGTKWNACHQEDKENRIPGLLRFDTPRKHPWGWIEELSDVLEDIPLDVRFACENGDGACGHYCIMGGGYVHDDCVPFREFSFCTGSGDSEPEDWVMFARQTWAVPFGFDLENMRSVPKAKPLDFEQYHEDVSKSTSLDCPTTENGKGFDALFMTTDQR